MFPGGAFQSAEHLPFYHVRGEAAALLIHGFPGTPADIRPLAVELDEAGWTTHGVLLPGFGPQIEKMLDYSYEDWLNSVEAALIKLREKHRPVMVVGYSLGGALATLLAARQPVDGLVLLAPFWKVDHVLWSLLPILKPLFRSIRPFRLLKLNFADPEVRAGIHNFLPGADLDNPVVQQHIRDFQLPLELFNQIRMAGQRAYQSAARIPPQVPMLVVQGADDDLVKPSLTRAMVKQFHTPMNYVEVPGKHDIPIENGDGWTAVREQVTQFADQVLKSNLTAADRMRSG